MKFTYPSGSRPLKGYTIKRGIGIGGFGEVYFALSDAGKEVALKKIQRNLDVELRGVIQCLNIKHVNLISLWDIQTSEQNESWVVMEYVPGPSLRDILYDYPKGLPESEIKLWMTSTASGVAHLHQRGIVHRDLKPGNIFRDDDAHVVKIGDYGLSKFISSRRSGHTETVGTVHYMAPEIGKGDYGKEIDIYALGIIFYELLTGEIPFDGESSQEIIVKHLTEMPNLDVLPSRFRDVIGKALEKSPGNRFLNVAAFVAGLPWPDVAKRSGSIATFHAIGVFPHERKTFGSEVLEDAAVGVESAAEGATIKPILVTDEDFDVVRSDIVFGPLSEHPGMKDDGADANGVESATNLDARRNIRKTTPPRRDVDRPYGSHPTPSQGLEESVRPRKLAKRTTVIGKEAFVQGEDDPIQVIRSSSTLLSNDAASVALPAAPWLQTIGEKFESLSRWWSDAALASPVKFILMMAVGAIVLAYPQWILPLAVCLGLVFCVHFLVKTWLADFKPTDSSQKSAKSKRSPANLLKRKSRIRRAALMRQTDAVREWIEVRPLADRLTELVGSFFVGAMSCIVLSLLAMAMHDSLFSPIVESWAYYTWIAITSSIACWIVLAFGKLWESGEGEVWFRRLMMGFVGFLIWIVATFFANLFNIDLACPLVGTADQALRHAAVIEVPILFGYAIFFVGLFVTLRWWRQADPVRHTRLSIWSVGLSLVWAAAISQLFGLPLIGSCVLASAISISVQLASPWLSTKRRELIQSTLKSNAKSVS